MNERLFTSPLPQRRFWRPAANATRQQAEESVVQVVEQATADGAPQAVLDAARAMAQGDAVQISDADMRDRAMAYAALAFALRRAPVHLANLDENRLAALAKLVAKIGAPHGVTVAKLRQDMDPAARRDAYTADIVLGSLGDLVSDVLRDVHVLNNASFLEAKVRKLFRHAKAPIVPRLGALICADVEWLLVDGALRPVALQSSPAAPQATAPLREAVAIARLLTSQDVDKQSLSPVGRSRVARMEHLYPAARPATEKGQRLIELALQALECQSVGASSTSNDPDVAPFLTYLSGATMPAPDAEIAARARVYQLIAAYPVVTGCGAVTAKYAGELKSLYKVRHVQSVGPHTQRPQIRAFATVTQAKRALEKLARQSDVRVVPSNTDAERLLSQPLCEAMHQTDAKDAIVWGDFASDGEKALFLEQGTVAPSAHWVWCSDTDDGLLPRILASMPLPVLTHVIYRVQQRWRRLKARKARAAVAIYETRLDKMTGFAGRSELPSKTPVGIGGM